MLDPRDLSGSSYFLLVIHPLQQDEKSLFCFCFIEKRWLSTFICIGGNIDQKIDFFFPVKSKTNSPETNNGAIPRIFL